MLKLLALAVISAVASFSVQINSDNQTIPVKIDTPPPVTTFPVPDAVKDSPYYVTLNGKPAPIERAGEKQPGYYVRFKFNGTVKVKAGVKTGGKVEMTLAPQRYIENATTAPTEVSFDVSKPGPRIISVRVDGKEWAPLFVIAEEYGGYKPEPQGYGIFNVKEYGVTSEGVQTKNIQKVLDACAAKKGGGVVYFGPGIYHTGTIRIKDNTTVYLAPGALILGSTDPADYPVDPDRKEQGTHGPVCSFSRLIIFDHCKNSDLVGYGVIDGMGHIVRNKHRRHVQLVDVTGCTNIKIEDVVLRNSAEWTLHILGCDKVRVNNLKIINDWGVDNTDGIDPDGSKNVFITRYFGSCGDDAVAVKTTGNSDLLKPAVNIEIKDSVVMTRKTALKVGTETYADVSDVLFENCDVVNSSRGCAIWMRDGGTISDVTYRDIRLDLREFKGEDKSGEPIRADLEKRNAWSQGKRVHFEGIYSKAPYRSVLFGQTESKLQDYRFKNCVFEMTTRTDKMNKKPAFELSNVKNFTFENCTLKWSEEQKDLWDGPVGQKDCENVTGL